MKTTQEMEQPAKQYQIEAIHVQLKSANDKLDNLLQIQNDYVTHPQLQESERKQKEYVDTKYGPIYKLFWAALTALVVASALIVLQLQKG